MNPMFFCDCFPVFDWRLLGRASVNSLFFSPVKIVVFTQLHNHIFIYFLTGGSIPGTSTLTGISGIKAIFAFK